MRDALIALAPPTYLRAAMTLGYEQFQWAAENLGLHIDPSSSHRLSDRVTLDGELDGLRVEVEQWAGQFVHVDFTAHLAPQADLRLSIREAGVASKLGELLGRHDITVGDPGFDSAFVVKADEPARAAALLTPALRESLMQWKRSGAVFYITDECVKLFVLPGTMTTLGAADLVANLQAVAALARALSDALRAVPPSEHLGPHIAAWRDYAARYGLGFSPSPLRAWGSLEGADFVARATAVHDHAWGVDLSMRFTQRLPWFVRVRHARFFDFLERTGDAAHTATGDEAFDHALRVTTTDPARAQRLLDRAVRAALLDLQTHEGDVVLDRGGLSVRTRAMADPSTFGRVVDRVAAVAHLIHANLT